MSTEEKGGSQPIRVVQLRPGVFGPGDQEGRVRPLWTSDDPPPASPSTVQHVLTTGPTGRRVIKKVWPN